MNIVLAGGGKVGFALSGALVREGHDVTLIDSDQKALDHASATQDILCVKGSGSNVRSLIEAGTSEADILISVTANDETNMLCCLMAKQLGAKYTIARIRDPEYTDSLSLLQKEMGIDMVINPERAAAYEISRLFRYPYAMEVETFSHGRVEMVQFRVEEKDGLSNKPLSALKSRLERVLVCAVKRDGAAIIPRGDFVIHTGDIIYVASDIRNMSAFFRRIGRNTQRVRSAMLIGGSHIAYYLAKIIAGMGVDLRILEIKAEKCMRLSEELPEASIICGDGTDQEVLLSEDIASMDALVALTDRDEENLMVGLFGVKQGLDKVIVKVNRMGYLDLLQGMGIDSVVSPKDTTTNTILRQVRARSRKRSGVMEKIYRIVDGQAEALEFTAANDPRYTNIPLSQLPIRQGTLIAMIVRGKNVITPFGSDHIEPGDTVLVVSRETNISGLEDILQ